MYHQTEQAGRNAFIPRLIAQGLIWGFVAAMIFLGIFRGIALMSGIIGILALVASVQMTWSLVYQRYFLSGYEEREIGADDVDVVPETQDILQAINTTDFRLQKFERIKWDSYDPLCYRWVYTDNENVIELSVLQFNNQTNVYFSTYYADDFLLRTSWNIGTRIFHPHVFNEIVTGTFYQAYHYHQEQTALFVNSNEAPLRIGGYKHTIQLDNDALRLTRLFAPAFAAYWRGMGVLLLSAVSAFYIAYFTYTLPRQIVYTIIWQGIILAGLIAITVGAIQAYRQWNTPLDLGTDAKTK